jgi:hypothetical protein
MEALMEDIMLEIELHKKGSTIRFLLANPL